MANPENNVSGQVQGEGDYESARKYQKQQHDFAKDPARVEKAAVEAEAALDGPEGEALEQARQEAAKGQHPRGS